MPQESLLQQLQEVAKRIRLLESEKKEAVARAQALERENRELIRLITVVGAKVDEILKIGATDDVSQPMAADGAPTPAVCERPEESSADPKSQPKRLLPNAFISD